MARPLPNNIPPRGLTPDQAAMYTGYARKTFDELVRQGLLPPAIPGGNYDRDAIDAALDRLSGLAEPSVIDWETEARRRIPREGHREVHHAPAK